MVRPFWSVIRVADPNGEPFVPRSPAKGRVAASRERPMALQKCPHCKTYVRENRSVCPNCDRELLTDHSGDGSPPVNTWESEDRPSGSWGLEDEGDKTLGPINGADRIALGREVDEPPMRRSGRGA